MNTWKFLGWLGFWRFWEKARHPSLLGQERVGYITLFEYTIVDARGRLFGGGGGGVFFPLVLRHQRVNELYI